MMMHMRGAGATRAHCSPGTLHSRHVARPRGFAVVRAAANGVNVEDAKRMIDKEGWKVLDVRSEKDYESSRITKPAMTSFNVPALAKDDATPNVNFVSQVASKFPSKAAKLIVMCQDGGNLSGRALAELEAAAYSSAVKLDGGYHGWTQVWSPSGKRKPPAGRWISTGKEALKSGLNIPGVAESYDEGGNLVQARYAKGLAAQEGP